MQNESIPDLPDSVDLVDTTDEDYSTKKCREIDEVITASRPSSEVSIPDSNTLDSYEQKQLRAEPAKYSYEVQRTNSETYTIYNTLIGNQDTLLLHQQIQDQICTSRTAVPSTTSSGDDLIQLKVTDNSEKIIHETLYTAAIDIELDTDIQVVTLNIDLASVNASEKKRYDIKPYEKDLQCVSYILSNKKKRKKFNLFCYKCFKRRIYCTIDL